ncbi:hypothetical protein NOCD_15005 [Nocardioides cavernae]|uniref:hypothetical protein n=1 Tax=Nocardioides TaxID=1839 RepID=UPI000A471590|nr:MULTISPECIES: hypothetical protein [Nocardioides]MCK9824793.1 hypothetical protein [Nocardioides cavernae]
MSDDPDRLPLDSPRWSQLWTRIGPGAYPVPQALRALGDDPSDLDLFKEMWPEICAEETTYDAAFAALPYLMDFAGRVEPADADEYLIVAGLIATYAPDVPSDLEPAFRTAMRRGLTLTLERLENCTTDADLRYLLASVAAMRGRTDLAEVLQDLDAIQETCPTCGTVVHPSALEAAVDRDRTS